MNERILEIAKRAGLKFPSETDLSPQEKTFAQLIVQECCQMMLDLEIKYPANLTVQEIKQHFGVEE